MTALTVARPSQSEFGQRRVHDNSDDEIEDVNVFFRFVDGKVRSVCNVRVFESRYLLLICVSPYFCWIEHDVVAL
jgi:hypothetical protein